MGVGVGGCQTFSFQVEARQLWGFLRARVICQVVPSDRCLDLEVRVQLQVIDRVAATDLELIRASVLLLLCHQGGYQL